MLETLNYTIRIDSTPTFLYFDLEMSSIESEARFFAKINNDVCFCLFMLTCFIAFFKHD